MIAALLNALAVVASLILTAVVLYALARWIGLGKCMTCTRSIAPWDAYCWRHRPPQ